MKARRIIFRILIIIVIGVVLGSTIYTINAKRVLHNEFPMPLGFGVSVVLTGSMEPTLNVNDLVVVVPADNYAEGDIVVFQREGQLIIHRIIMVSGETVVTQGDNNDTADEPITLGDIKGKLKFSVPFVGLIVRGIKSVPGVLLILALAFFLIYRSWQNEKKADNSELDKIKDEIRRLKSEVEEGENNVETLKAQNEVQADTMADIQAEIERLKRELAGGTTAETAPAAPAETRAESTAETQAAAETPAPSTDAD